MKQTIDTAEWMREVVLTSQMHPLAAVEGIK